MASADRPERFEIQGGRAFYRPLGTVSPDDAVDMISGAIAYAREQAISELVVNISALGGFAPPPVVDRYFLMQKWADIAGGKLRLVLVARGEMIDPARFGITVAANRGLVADIVETEADALAWLDRLAKEGPNRGKTVGA